MARKARINWLPVASDFVIVVCGMCELRLFSVFAYSRQITTQTENVLEQGESAGSSSYVALLRQYSSAKAFSSGKHVHAHIIKDGYVRERFLGNLLVQMYGRCCSLSNARTVFDTIDGKNVFSWTIMIATYGHYGYLEYARELFDKMPQRNLVSWNAMIAAYTQHGEEQNALSLFREMELQDTEPDKTTLFNVLSACTNLADISEDVLQVWRSI